MVKRLMWVVAVGLLAALAMYGVAMARHGVLITQLDGTQEVNAEGQPAGDSDGAGFARIRLNPDSDQVCFKLRWTNIGTPTAAHIHRAERGSNGDVVVPLFTTKLPDTISGVTGCTSGVDDSLSGEIRDNPKGFYVNIHNEEFPSGAIRGQLKHAPRG